MKNIKYPTRCQIVDVTGKIWHSLPIKTPEISKPYIGEYGIAYFTQKRQKARIKLDNGIRLWGYQCWWRPVKNRRITVMEMEIERLKANKGG